MTSLFEGLEDYKQKIIVAHLEAIIEVNKTTNLTRIDSFEEAMLLHVEDSLSALPELDAAPAGRYADLGSGAGYPGIPLAIATGRETLLVDARQKKMLALDAIISELGIHDLVSTYAGRAELLARSKSGDFAVITARALAKLSVLMELASPLLQKGGVLVCYKAHMEDDEMADALRVQKLVGMELLTDRSFAIGDYARRIVTFKKVGKGTVKLPRLEGQAQKNPL